MCFCLKCLGKQKYRRLQTEKTATKFSLHKWGQNIFQKTKWLNEVQTSKKLQVKMDAPNMNKVTKSEFLQPTSDTQPPIHAIRNDYLALHSIRTGAVVLPTDIPDVPPVDHSGDLGTLHFSISYDVYEELFKVLIKGAEHLPAKDIFGTSDPYVKLTLLPKKRQSLTTRVKKKNLNPHWNEVFSFERFPHAKLEQMRLHFLVLDYDRFSKNDEIGEVEIALKDILLQKEPIELSRNLNHCKDSKGCPGHLLVSLSYKPNTGHLIVVIMKCYKLKPMDVNGKSDPYVKVCLSDADKKMSKKKTTVKERSLDPVWNEAMVFEVPFHKAREVQILFTVMDFDKHLPNKEIGKVLIGPRLNGLSTKHWCDMMNSPRKSIAMWHRINAN